MFLRNHVEKNQIPMLDSAGIFCIMILNNVHIEGKHMNTVVTSKDEIMQAIRELLSARGWSSISNRYV